MFQFTKRTMVIALASLAIVAAIGWFVREARLAKDIELTYRLEFPAKTFGEIEVEGKKRSVVYRYDWRKMYVHQHAKGWQECLKWFLQPVPGSGNRTLLDPFDDGAVPSLKQYDGVARAAETDGFTLCRLQLKELSEKFGTNRVRRVLRQKMP